MVEQLQESSIGASTEKMREGAREFKDAVTASANEKLGEYKEKLGEYSDQAKEKITQYSEQATDYVHKNPMTALAIAFGAGALLGLLLFRRGE